MKNYIWKRIVSFVLALALITGMTQGVTLEVKAAEDTTNFYLYCSTCKKNIGARAKINGTAYNTGDFVTVSTSSPNTVEIISADGEHVLETISWNHSKNNGTFSVPIYHKTDVTVRVKDAAGKPVANRKVYTDWDNVSGTTDNNGEFKFPTRSIWYLTVTVEDPNGNISKTQTASNNGGLIEITIPNRRSVNVHLKSSENQVLTGDENLLANPAVTFSETSDGVYKGVFLVGNTYTVTVSGIPGHHSASKSFTVTDSMNSLDLVAELAEPKVMQGSFMMEKEVSSVELKVGETKQNFSIAMDNNVNGYDLHFLSARGPGGSYKWESTDRSVFEVGENGSYKYITAKSVGTADLKVTVNSCGVSKTKVIPVTVTKADPSATVTAPESVVYSDYNGDFTFHSNVAGTFKIMGKNVPVNANEDVKRTVKELVINRPVGPVTLQWEFTPTETDKYNSQTGKVTYNVEAKDITNTGTLTFAKQEFIYDGNVKEVSNIEVKVGDKILTKDTDYTVSYSNNVNAGEATITVTGNGNYTGAISKTFTIEKAALSVEKVTSEDRVYDGTKKVKITDVVLKNKAAKDAVGNVINISNLTAVIDAKNVGRYTEVTALSHVELKDTANYVLSHPTEAEVIPLTDDGVMILPKKVNVENVVIEESKIYDGSVSAKIMDKGAPSVNYDGEDLFVIQGTASYTDKNVGKDKIVVFDSFSLGGTAAANYELEGQPISQNAEITKKPLNLMDGSANVKDKYYDGTNTAEFSASPKLSVGDMVIGDDVSLELDGTPIFNGVGSPDEENKVAVTLNMSLSGTDACNYDLQIPEVSATIKNYIAEKGIDYIVNSNEWQNQDFEVTAGDGCQIAENLNSTWMQKMIVSCENNNSKTGTITFYVKYPDGKVSKVVQEEYKIDKIVPTGTVTFTDAENTWNSLLESIVFKLFYKDAQEVVITAKDQEELSGVATIEWCESLNEGLTLEQVKNIDKWENYDGNLIVSLKDAKKFVYYVKITDRAGNVTYLSSDGAVYDTQSPAIIGITDGETYYTTQKVTVTDVNLEKVTVNEKVVDESGYVLPGNIEASYTVVAVDKAGNRTTVNVTMKPIASITDSIKNLTTDNVTGDDADEIQTAADVLAAVSVTNATEEEKHALEDAKNSVTGLQKVIEETAGEVAGLKDNISGYDKNSVKSTDKESVIQLMKDIEETLKDANLSEAQKLDLATALEDAKNILGEIQKNNQALNDALDSVKDITSDNYNLDDKEELKEAAKKLEAIVNENNKSYTEAEKKAAKKELERINGILDSIEEAEEEASDSNSPDTGDYANVFGYLGVIIASAMAIICLLLEKRKERR